MLCRTWSDRVRVWACRRASGLEKSEKKIEKSFFSETDLFSDLTGFPEKKTFPGSGFFPPVTVSSDFSCFRPIGFSIVEMPFDETTASSDAETFFPDLAKNKSFKVL